jgi:hypothetical protein
VKKSLTDFLSIDVKGSSSNEKPVSESKAVDEVAAFDSSDVREVAVSPNIMDKAWQV